MSLPTNITTALQMASPAGKLRTFGLLASPEDWFKTDFVVGHDQISHHPNYDAHSSRWLSICSIEPGDYLLGDRDANRLVFALEDSSLFKDFKGDVGKLQFAIVIELINVCRACEPEDTLLIMLYGHGDLNEGTGDVEEGTAYLWLHGNVSDKLQKSTLEDILKCSGHHAGQVYLSSSSCYSGAMVSGEWTNFTACAANETSDSRFTYHSRVSEEKSCLPFIPCPVARYHASRTEPPIRNLHLHLSLEALVSALHEGPELTSAPHANTMAMAIRYRMEKLSVDEKKELHKMLGGCHILREIFFAVAVNIGLYFDADSPEDLLMYRGESNLEVQMAAKKAGIKARGLMERAASELSLRVLPYPDPVWWLVRAWDRNGRRVVSEGQWDEVVEAVLCKEEIMSWVPRKGQFAEMDNFDIYH